MSVRANKRTYALGFFLQTGWLPWGHQFADPGRPPFIVRCGADSGQRPVRWIMCCGHVMTTAEVSSWKVAGLAVDGPLDRFGRATIIAGPALAQWLSNAWQGLLAKRWALANG